MGYTKPTRPSQLPELRAQLVDDDPLWEAIDLLSFIHSDFQHPTAIRQGLREATLWWVGADCCDLLEQVAPSMPPIHLTTDLVPDVDGFVCFERPMSGSHGQLPGVEVTFDLVQWQPTIIQGLASLSMIPWRLYTDANTLVSPMGRSDWPYGFLTDQRCHGVTDLEHQSIVEDRRLVAALWQLTAQPTTTQTNQITADRATRRRLARRGHTPAAVRLVNLRRRTRTTTPPTSTATGREYSCQWIVRSHWRQQAYGPGRTLRKAILIDQHIRGPADKPLRVRDAVKVWRQH